MRYKEPLYTVVSRDGTFKGQMVVTTTELAEAIKWRDIARQNGYSSVIRAARVGAP